MPHSTGWERAYEEHTAECAEAAALSKLSREWPISGPLARTFNPGGHPLSDPKKTGDATPTPSDRR